LAIERCFCDVLLEHSENDEEKRKGKKYRKKNKTHRAILFSWLICISLDRQPESILLNKENVMTGDEKTQIDLLFLSSASSSSSCSFLCGKHLLFAFSLTYIDAVPVV